jgi:hypothetical protein
MMIYVDADGDGVGAGPGKVTCVGSSAPRATPASSAASAAPTVYAFDSVSRIDLDTARPSITGILRNTTTPITVSFADNTNADFRFAVSRCVPRLPSNS